MKIVQSFWTGNKDCQKDGHGWESPIYHYASWILSCNQLRQYYDDVILVTDKAGYDVLIKKLHLPYTDVIVCLDELSKYNPNLWALAKIKAYGALDEPFIHVDGDVFVWDKFDTSLGHHDLIAQNIETTTDYYRTMWNQIRSAIDILPEAMEKYNQDISNKAYNMGIFGGNDIPFIKAYCKQAFDFVDQNLEKVNKLDGINFNIFFEQVLLYEFASSYGKDVATYIKEDIGDNEYQGFADFDNVPEGRKYLHLLGFYKKMPTVCNKMLAYVIKYYPEYVGYLEDLLGLKPTMMVFGREATHNSMNSEIVSYKDALLNEGLDTRQDDRNIVLRDISSIGSSRELNSYLKSGQEFVMVPTNGFSLEERQIRIKELYDNEMCVPALSVDPIIFEVIGNKINNKRFCNVTEGCLNDSFPENKKKDFFNFLWKRISLLMSYGLLVPIKNDITNKSDYSIIIDKSRKESVDALKNTF